jgi:hypothetical protein
VTDSPSCGILIVVAIGMRAFLVVSGGIVPDQ